MRDRVPEMEYFFCDTGAELPETYDYLDKLEVILGKPIARLNSDRGFDHYFEVFRGMLPSPQMRWCTREMKIKPLEDWLGDDPAVSYVAIRADEKNRKGYVSTKPNISAVFPFIEEDIDHAGVLRILDEAGVGLPEYYEWRTRSGCYFCFFQRKAEWVGLAERHPELFEKAVAIENKVLIDAGVDGEASYTDHAMEGRLYTWSQGETLVELIGRKDQIMERHEIAMERAKSNRKNIPLLEVLSAALDDDDDGEACVVCAL
jgi:3'-phosphoadenosine 5'-phosphosulfate sulfotransferase (PAPS reductase)/FAD synthetase